RSYGDWSSDVCSSDLIVSGSDGNLWFTEEMAGQIGRVSKTGVFKEFALPAATSEPQGIASGPDKNLWFTEYGAGKIGRITTAGKIGRASCRDGGCGEC